MRNCVICILNLWAPVNQGIKSSAVSAVLAARLRSSVSISLFRQPLFSLFNCFGQAMSSFSLLSSLELTLPLTHQVAACLALSPESAISPFP